MHDASRLASVQTVPSGAQQQGGARVRRDQRGAAPGQPGVERLLGRDAVGDAALLAALAEHAEQAAAPVDVVDVQPDQFADPDAAGVEQLEDERVAQADRFLGAGGATPRTARA